MKILSIGNSFSTDAHKWLAPVAADVGVEIEAHNLYIGRCPLEKHWNNFCTAAPDYELQIGGETVRPGSINEALTMESWDVITMQQGSALSGLWDTYQPYLGDLYREVRKLHPHARVYLHQTWSYEIDSPHEAFVNYNRDQKQMIRCITEAYQNASALIGEPVLPVGQTVQYLREHVRAFDYANGGLSLTRDGHHLSWLYGRYAAALVWCAVLTGKDIRQVQFIPEYDGQRADPVLLEAVRQGVWQALQNM